MQKRMTLTPPVPRLVAQAFRPAWFGGLTTPRARRGANAGLKPRATSLKPALVVLVVCVSMLAAVAAQRKATLTPQDHLDIQDLVSRYAYAADSGAGNRYAYADLFAADGELVGPQGSTKGREALAAIGRTAPKPMFGVRHFIFNHIVEPSAEGATGKQYVVLIDIGVNGQGGGEFSNIGGHYEDVYARTPQGWRFKRREYIPVKAGPPPGPAASRAQQSGTKAPPRAKAPSRNTGLTAQDYIDIRALANQYAYGLDTGADDGWLYGNVFAKDGEFHGPPAVPGGTPFDAKGRDNLRKFAVGGRGSAYVRHFMSDHLIEPSPEGATGKVYLLVIDIGQDGKSTSVNMGGHYVDVYVRTEEGWRIKTRNFFRSKSAQTLQEEAARAPAKDPAQPK